MANTIHSVLFATDLSDSASTALRYATGITLAFGAKLFLVHVLDPAVANSLMDSSSSGLRNLAENAKSELTRISKCLLAAQGVPSEVLVRHGNVRDMIFQIQQEYAADLIVLGSSGNKAGRGRGFGSIAEAILRSMPCSVLTIGPKVKPHFVSTETQTILFPTDFSERTLGAISAAVSLAAKFSANLLLLHICDPHEHHSCFEHEMACKRKLNEIARSIEKQEIKVEQRMREGRIEENILAVAREEHADFIVMGVHGGDLEDGTRLHGIVSEVVREADCPVLATAHQQTSHHQ
jgi:nucleotide-binding universal stress UspA family protein